MALVLRTPKNDLDLGNPLRIWTLWAELARLMGDDDGAFGQLLFVPQIDDDELPEDFWSLMQDQAILALKEYGSQMSDELKGRITQITETPYGG